MQRQVNMVVLMMLLHPLMILADQHSGFNISSLDSKARQAHDTLLRASIFSIGPVGYAAQVSETELSLRRLVEEKEAIAVLTDLLAHATPEGKMYALYGLYVKDREVFNRAVKRYKGEHDLEKEVGTQSGCIVMTTYAKTVITKIETGQYDLLFRASANRN
jgi:hypothetical protein